MKVDPFWQTPVWETNLPFNDEFNENLLKELHSIGSGIAYGVDENPHDSLWDYDAPCLNQLKKAMTVDIKSVLEANFPDVKTMNLAFNSHMCWPNITEPGESLEIHAHTDATIAATYFVKTPEKCGDLIVFNPTDCIDWAKGALSEDNQLKIKRITPVAGKFVFFPSYALHCVEENKSDDLRVSITCDFKYVVDKFADNALVLKSWANKMVKICSES